MTKVSGINSSTSTQKVKKTKNEPKEKGSWRALGASQIAGMASLPVGMASVAGMSQVNKKLSPDQIKAINEAAEKALKDSGLAEKGVEIINLTEADLGVKLKGWKDSLLRTFNAQYATAKGKNAFYHPMMNSIGVNKDKFSTATFHELGHAFNANKSKFWGAMQKMRMPSMLLATGLAIFAAFTKKAESKDGEELTKGQKAKNFVRNNAGYIAGASMLPVVAEEVMASIRGCKWANANLPKELAKKVKTTNIFGAVSYVAAAAAVALSAVVATKVKDSIMEKQKAKFEAEQNNNIQSQEKIEK